jgi:hypothetical protein
MVTGNAIRNYNQNLPPPGAYSPDIKISAIYRVRLSSLVEKLCIFIEILGSKKAIVVLLSMALAVLGLVRGK